MIERPGKIVAIGLNYMDHVRESGAEPPKRPLVFAKFPTAAIGLFGLVSGLLSLLCHLLLEPRAVDADLAGDVQHAVEEVCVHARDFRSVHARVAHHRGPQEGHGGLDLVRVGLLQGLDRLVVDVGAPVAVVLLGIG